MRSGVFKAVITPMGATFKNLLASNKIPFSARMNVGHGLSQVALSSVDLS